MNFATRKPRSRTRIIYWVTHLAKAFNIEGEDLVNMKRGALLHDIGKMGIPDAILNKNGSLNPVSG